MLISVEAYLAWRVDAIEGVMGSVAAISRTVPTITYTERTPDDVFDREPEMVSVLHEWSWGS